MAGTGLTCCGHSMTNDVPYVTWSPNLNTNGEVRVYKVWGKARLDDAGEKDRSRLSVRGYLIALFLLLL